MCRLSWNLEASTFWNPQGLSRPVMGLLYLLFCIIYYMLYYIILHHITLHCIFVFAFHFMSCVIFVYVSVWHDCCAIIHCYNDMFHILNHAGYMMNLWNVCNVNVNVNLNLYAFTNQLPVGVHGSIELLALSVIGVELALKLRWIGWKTILKHKRTMIKVSLLQFFL